MKKTIFFCLIFIMFFSFTSAILPPCHERGIRGDVNNNLALDLTDGIFILNYLYMGGPHPECLERADFDGSNIITLTDVIGIFNFLFKGGPPPYGGLYFAGVDDPPQIGFPIVVDENDINQNYGEVEVTVKLPNILYVSDLTYENDIRSCTAQATPISIDNTAIGEPKTIFESKWHLIDGFNGNDISREPIALLLDPAELLFGHRYEIAVTCSDMAGREDTEKIIINTLLSDIPPGGAICDVGDLCCIREDDDYTNCIVGAAAGDPQGNIGCQAIQQAGGIAGTWHQVDVSACNQPPGPLANRKKLDDSSFVELGETRNQAPSGTCEVKKMTILRGGDTIPPNFRIPPPFDEQTFGEENKLGYKEGWRSIIGDGKRTFFYRYGYDFLVVAILKGTNPDACPEHQFVQRTFSNLVNDRSAPSGVVEKEHSLLVKDSMYSDDLLATMVLKDYENGINKDGIKMLLTVDEISAKKDSDVDVGKGCEFAGIIWCDDDYAKPYGGPGKKQELWDHETKKHDISSIEIMWYDMPGQMMDWRGIQNGVGITPPWTRNTGSISPNILLRFSFNAMAIVENSDGAYRWVCTLKEMDMINNPPAATNNEKLQMSNEPKCECKKEEFIGTSWVPTTESNNCGPVSA